MTAIAKLMYKLNDDKTTSGLSVEEYIEYIEKRDVKVHYDNCIVGVNDIEDIRVSTVFTEVALYDLHFQDPPDLFETSVQGQHGEKFISMKFRYKTWQDALEAHEKIVDKIKNSSVEGIGELDFKI